MRIFISLLIFVSSYTHASCYCPGDVSIQSLYALNDKIYLGKFLSNEPPSEDYPWGRAKFQVTESLKGILSSKEFVNKGNPYKCGFHTQGISLHKELLIMSSSKGDIPMCTNIKGKSHEQFIHEIRVIQKQLNKTLNLRPKGGAN